MSAESHPVLFQCFHDVSAYAALLNGVRLRSYQAEAGAAIYRAAMTGGGNLSVMFPRQSGKNELEAQLEIFLMILIQSGNSMFLVKNETMRRIIKFGKPDISFWNFSDFLSLCHDYKLCTTGFPSTIKN